MAVRVRDFLRAHKTEGVGDGTALAHFEELVARAETLAGQQRAGVVATRSATLQRGGLAAGVADQAAALPGGGGGGGGEGQPGIDGAVPAANNGTSSLSFLTTARGMLEKATGGRSCW